MCDSIRLKRVGRGLIQQWKMTRVPTFSIVQAELRASCRSKAPTEGLVLLQRHTYNLGDGLIFRKQPPKWLVIGACGKGTAVS